jgi:hypothetical protein
MSGLSALAAVAIVVFVVVRQLRGEALRGKRLIVLPVVLTVVGFFQLDKKGLHLTTPDVLCLLAGAVIAAAVGAGQGGVMRLEPRDGVLWASMPPRGLWLWGALLLSRVGMMFLDRAVGAEVAASATPALLLLGINRLAQAAVVAPRALASGVPFAPERNGRPFEVGGVLGGRFGESADRAAVGSRRGRRTRGGAFRGLSGRRW